MGLFKKILDAIDKRCDKAIESRPAKKFLFVEDGSVDTDALIESLKKTNPEIKVVVYRQGCCPPKLTDVNGGCDGH